MIYWHTYIQVCMHNCHNPNAFAAELPQSSTQPSIFTAIRIQSTTNRSWWKSNHGIMAVVSNKHTYSQCNLMKQWQWYSFHWSLFFCMKEWRAMRTSGPGDMYMWSSGPGDMYMWSSEGHQGLVICTCDRQRLIRAWWYVHVIISGSSGPGDMYMWSSAAHQGLVICTCDHQQLIRTWWYVHVIISGSSGSGDMYMWSSAAHQGLVICACDNQRLIRAWWYVHVIIRGSSGPGDMYMWSSAAHQGLVICTCDHQRVIRAWWSSEGHQGLVICTCDHQRLIRAWWYVHVIIRGSSGPGDMYMWSSEAHQGFKQCLPPVGCQSIIWTNADSFSGGPIVTNFVKFDSKYENLERMCGLPFCYAYSIPASVCQWLH